MKELFKNAVEKNLSFWVCLCISICLLIASFILPPTGVIDPSVLAGVGELFAFGSLGTVIYAIKNGTSAKVTHGDTTLEVKKNDEEDNTI